MLLTLVLLLCLSSPVLAGQTYHVSQQGDNAKGQGSEARPWKTLAHAATQVKGGDTVLIGPGTFRERLRLPARGTKIQPVTFRGTRGATGEYETVLDGSTAVSEDAWKERGDGSFTTQLPQTPQAMTAQGLNIWRVGQHAWSEGPRAPGVFGIPPNEDVNTNIGPVKFWDGIGALFGFNNGTTYLRFRNKEHPRDMDVRWAPSGAVVTVETNGVVIEHVKIVGGQYAIKVTNGARDTVIQDCYLTHGKWRILIEGNAQNTVIQRNTLTADGIGFHDPALPAGDWNPTSYPRIVNRHRYDENKFLVGDTETDDSQIELREDTGTKILNNVLRDSNAGITFHGTTHDADIAGNQIYRHADNCVYINADYASVSFHHNLVYDCDHLMRFQSTQQNMQWAVYANSFWQPPGTGKHIFMNAPDHQPGDSTIAIYQNSCAGTGWCVDVGSDGQHVSLPFVYLSNLLISTDDLSSWGDVGWGSKDAIWHDNLWYGGQHVPDFKLPTNHGATNSAPGLSAPGMTEQYYVDQWPDHGSTQGGQGITPPGPTPPTPTPGPDTTPPTVRITAPSNEAIVSGARVALIAEASDNTKVTGVQLYVGGAPKGNPGCCVSVDWTIDTTTIKNGTYVLTAEASDAAGNKTMSAPVTVVVYNGPKPPDPEPPVPPTASALHCTGDLEAQGKLVMDCVPQAQR